MKKMLTACLVTALLGIPLVAQEDDGQQAQSQDPRAAMAAAMAAQGYIMPGQVTTPLGRITLHGMFAGGLMGYMKDNTAVDKTDQFDNDDEDWTLVPFDASWQANIARVSLTYENGNYGGYFEFSAEDWNGNPEKNFNTEFFVRHAFVWRSFFDSKLRLSLGKLYGENYQTRERIWKTEGATNGGWDFTENNLKYNMSFRLEYKPIDGLNVGLQWDFLPLGQSLNAMAGPNMFESLKEIAIAGEYKTDLFNVVGGVRFDGADGMNKFDFYGYLNDYYGEWGFIGNPTQNAFSQMEATYAPHFKHGDEVYGKVYDGGSGSVFSTANADKPFDGSIRVIGGFSFKGVQNLTAIAQASFWNLGAWDKFGAGSVDETFKYQVTPQFNAGIILYQQFYGSDVFPDDMVNSPYFAFEPTVSYQLTPNINAYLVGTYGICQDVLESYWKIKPGLTFIMGGFGAFRVEVFYKLESTTYTDKALKGASMANGNIKLTDNLLSPNPAKGGDPIYQHGIGLSCMWMF